MSASGYVGVCWDKQESKWKARVMRDKKNHELGFFDDPRAAALVRSEFIVAAELAYQQELRRRT